ncbi:putative ribonuclease H-like domain-containing protein [Tanacetum coccineum]
MIQPSSSSQPKKKQPSKNEKALETKQRMPQATGDVALKKRIHRLEWKKMSRPTCLKRLRKVGMSRRVESFEDQESLGAPEDASKQRRSIEDIDVDVDDDKMHVEAIVDVKKEQILTNDSTTGSKQLSLKLFTHYCRTDSNNLRPKDRWVVCYREHKRKDQIALDEQIARDIQAKLDAELLEEQKLARKQEEEANIALIESWENTQAMMEADRLPGCETPSKEREEIDRHIGGYTYKQLKGKSFDEIQKLFDKERKRVNTFVAMGSEVQESKEQKEEGREEIAKGSRKKLLGRKRVEKEQQKGSSKKQKVEEEKESDEVDELRRAEMKVLRDIFNERNAYKGIDKEDLEALWRIVKEKYDDTRPDNEFERVLLVDLKVMFELDKRIDVWGILQGYKDLEQIHEDDLEAMDLKWQLRLLCGGVFTTVQKLGTLCQGVQSTKKQGLVQFKIKDHTRSKETIKSQSLKAMLAMMVLRGITTDKTCSKTCLKNYETLKKQCDDLLVKLNESEFKAATYKRGLATLEDQIITYKKNEVLFSEEVAVLKREKQSTNVVCEKESKNYKENSDESLVEEQITQDKSSFVESSPNVDKETVFPANKKQTALTRRSVHEAKRHYYTGRHYAVNTARSYSGQVNAVRVKGVNAVTSLFSHDLQAVLMSYCMEELAYGVEDYWEANTKLLISPKVLNPITSLCLFLQWIGLVQPLTKDETSEILKNFIKEVENLVDKKVKIIRSDNGTEFKNKVMDDFCKEKGKFDGKSDEGTSEENRQDCIVMLIWKDTSYFDSPTKDVDNGQLLSDKKKSKPTSEQDSQRTYAIQNFNKFGYSVISPNGKKAIGTKWVFKNKKDKRGIVIRNKQAQDKYVAEILKKFNYSDVKSASTPVDLEKPLVKDGDADDVDVHLYRSMIGSLMYLTASRPDIMFAVCACARFQVTPKTSHLLAVKRIFRYLKGKPTLGLWYSRDSPFELVAYTDSDYAGATQDRKSTTGGCQFLGNRLISWQCKKQTVVATSTTEAEYVAAASCCGQVLWIQNQLLDYGYNFMNTVINIDNNSTICIIENPVQHSKTKHIEIRHHFIRDCNAKKLIQMVKIHTDYNVADLLTKGFDAGRFQYLVSSIGMLNP